MVMLKKGMFITDVSVVPMNGAMDKVKVEKVKMKMHKKLLIILFALTFMFACKVTDTTAGNTTAVSKTTGGQSLTVSITSPQDNKIVVVPDGEQGIEGLVRLDAGTANSDDINVVYVLDVSGSTSSDGNDINGDGQITAADDVNGDGRSGTILDAEIAGVIALNKSFGNPTNVKVGLISFNSGAIVNDLSFAAGVQIFTTPQADIDGNGINDLEEAVKKLRYGGGTNFNSALVSMNNMFNNLNATALGVSFFMSDGFDGSGFNPDNSTTLNETIRLGVKVNTFAVGIGADASLTGKLAKIAANTGGAFDAVTDPSALATALPAVQVVGIKSVDIDGTAVTLSPIGTFDKKITGITAGNVKTVNVTVTADDGTVAIASIDLNGVGVAVADFSADSTMGMEPFSVNFTNLSGGGVSTYSWDFGDGNVSTDKNPAHTYAAQGIYSVSLTSVGDGGTSTETKADYIEVIPRPVVVAGFTSDIVEGTAPVTVTFTDSSTSTDAISSYAWDFGDGEPGSTEQSPVHIYLAEGLYSVRLTVESGGVFDTEEKLNFINVLRAKESGSADNGILAGCIADPTAGFAPLVVDFVDISSGNITTWAWGFGNGDTSTEANPQVTYKTAGIYTVTQTVSGAAGADVLIKTNLINVLSEGTPIAEFKADPTAGLAELPVNFTDLSAGKVSTWAWEFGDGNTSKEQNPANLYKTAGFFTVTLTVSGTNGADSEIKTNLISVLPTPPVVAEFTADPTAGLAPLSVQFADLSAGAVTTRAWEFGDGDVSSEQNPLHVYKSEGFYTAKLTSSGSSGADSEIKTNLIHVLPGSGVPVANFSASATSGFAPLTVEFTDLSAGAVTSYAWDFGDGGTSVDKDPENIYKTEGFFTVSLTASGSGGTDIETKINLINIRSEGPPVAAFSASPTSGLPTLNVKFTDLSQPGGNISTWTWDFGDGGSSAIQSPAHDYKTAGLFTASLTVSNSNGSDTEIKTNLINVGTVRGPVADFKASTTGGLPPLNVQFTDLSQPEGNISTWTWDFGDGGSSIDQNPSHTYNSEGIFTVKLTVSNSAGADTETKNNLINVISGTGGAPVADFSATPTAGRSPLLVQFTDFSQPEGNIDSWTWDFGDGGTSSEQNPSHNFRKEGLFSVKLTVSNSGGASTETKNNLINVSTGGTLQVDFSASPTAGKSPLTVQFTDLSEPADDIASWLWDFGDGGSSVEQNPTHVYRGDSGFYSVKLTASNANGATTETKTNLIQITGEGAPVPDFSASPTAGQVPLTVTFTDLSEPADNIVSWLWNFGDGGSSIDSNPKHNYKREGFFSVGLTVSSSGGASTETKTNLINVSGLGTPVANFSASPTAGKVPLNVNFKDLSEPSGLITSFLWDFGDGATETEQSPTHTYRTEGFFTVSLTVSNEGGANIENKTNLIFVKGEGVPVAQFTASPNAGKPPLDVQFKDTSEGDISSWLWSFGDGTISDDESPQHTYQTPGIYTVSLGVSGAGGADSEKKTNLVRIAESGKVQAAFTGTPQIGIVPLFIDFTDNTAGEVDSWLWNFGDGATSDEQNPSHEYLTPGDYTVKLMVSGPDNTDEESKTNFIRAISDEDGSFAAFFDYEPVIGFSPVDVQFFDQTEGVNAEPDSWDWKFGDGDTSTEETPLHEYVHEGKDEKEFDVTLTVGVDGEEGSFTIKKAVKVVKDSKTDCEAIMSIKPDPVNLKSRRAVKANIDLSSGCIGTIDDIICDSIEMAGARPVKCKTKRGNFIAEFNAADFDITKSGKVVFLLTGKTTEGDEFTAIDEVTVK